jgi:NAD(P)-dependent dehydrogenase (short-subunit alcohol dehydrogenase family)
MVPLLKATAADADSDVRVVVVSSIAHQYADKPMRLHDLNWFQQGEFTPTQAYFQSKLANILFARELGKKLQVYGITTCSLHPGRANF